MRSLWQSLRASPSIRTSESKPQEDPPQGQTLLLDNCRKRASEGRLLRPKTASKERLATRLASTVRSVSRTVEISMGYEGQKSGRAWPIVPDPDWPGMYRVQKTRWLPNRHGEPDAS